MVVFKMNILYFAISILNSSSVSRLTSRKKCSVEEFTAALALRAEKYGKVLFPFVVYLYNLFIF